MRNRAYTLLLVLGLLAVLILIGSAVISLASGETRMVRLQNNSIRAFYLAEAGMEDAIARIKKGADFNDFTGKLYSQINEYSVDITPNTLPAPSPAVTTYVINSSGSYPDINSADKVSRRVSENIDVKPNGDPSKIINAIEVNGELKISGAAVINGGIKQNAILDFELIFDVSKEEMEQMAYHKYTDPENNVIPVDKITWVNLANQSSFVISETGWSGSGILVVKAPAGSTSPTLEIEGGTFNGVIWVIGNLRITGNAVINGAVFVEDGSAEITKLTGTPRINYDPAQVASAFVYLGNSVLKVYEWQEIQ
ncbi:MAG: hypothetical protein PHO42_05635 [Candidatus Omnitrophica bacterium]|nr:hypothetical protein [Candidatus Omnitrophota bacterium]